jgi:RNA polymerase sigma-70 factor (ECF subfamily)
VPAAGNARRTRDVARSLMREALAQEMDLAERDLYEFGGAHCDRVVAAVLARLAATTGTVPGGR